MDNIPNEKVFDGIIEFLKELSFQRWKRRIRAAMLFFW